MSVCVTPTSKEPNLHSPSSREDLSLDLSNLYLSTNNGALCLLVFTSICVYITVNEGTTGTIIKL